MGIPLVAILAVISLVVCLAAFVFSFGINWTVGQRDIGGTLVRRKVARLPRSKERAVRFVAGRITMFDLFGDSNPRKMPMFMSTLSQIIRGSAAWLWFPPIVLGIVAASMPLLPTGDARADGFLDARRCFVFLGIVYALFAIPARRAFRIMMKERETDRAAQNQEALLAGRCPSCGYDLRATPDRCPQCGTTWAQVAQPDFEEN